MKKKVLALVVLAAMLISILPFAAFAADGDINVYGSSVSVETEKADVVAKESGSFDATDDGVEFQVVAVTDGTDLDGKLFIASSRGTTDAIFYKENSKWHPYDTENGLTIKGSKVETVDIKVLSNIAGTVKLAFGTDKSSVNTYAEGKEFGVNESLTKIIGQKLYSATFETASVDKIEIKISDGKDEPANGVDTYELQAYVSSAGYPASGQTVTFSIVDGVGATLTASTATTNSAGKATVKIYSTKPGTYEVQAKCGSEKTGKDDNGDNVKVTFASTGVVKIKAESDDNQKFARENSAKDITFKYSVYDTNGNKIKLEAPLEKATVAVVTKPSGSSLDDEDFKEGSNDDGLATLTLARKYLDKDGDYEVKYYLVNGSAVTYKFSAKEQGEVVAMTLEYDSSNYAAEATVKAPEVKYADAEGYTTTANDFSDLRFTISDATFLNGTIGEAGGFTLAEDKTGVVTMTAIDTDKDLVATQVLTIQKAASALKLTAPSATPATSEAEVKIQLVDADGNAAASGRDAVDGKAMIISKPDGAIVTVGDVDLEDFAKGTASVKVTSYVAGTVKVQVVITEKNVEGKAGKVYTGACDVVFGESGAVEGNQVVFMIGASSYIVDGKPMAATSVPFIENGRTYLGIRDMAYAMGISDDFVKWDQATQTATITKNGVTVEVTVGAAAIKVTKDNVTTETAIDAPAKNVNGRVFLPFRAVFEAFGYEVEYANGVITCK